MFLNSQTDLGKLVGEIISKTSGLSYWDNPFQVTLHSRQLGGHTSHTEHFYPRFVGKSLNCAGIT